MRKKITLKTTFWAILISIITFSCGPPKTRTVLLKSHFNLYEVSWFYKKGKNTILGQAFLRTRGGEIKTCAGYEVNLIPASRYAEERMKALYENTQKGFLHIYYAYSKRTQFVPESPEYLRTKKPQSATPAEDLSSQTCQTGEYFVITEVIWEVPSYYGGGTHPTGGYLMQRVKLKGGETKEIILTN